MNIQRFRLLYPVVEIDILHQSDIEKLSILQPADWNDIRNVFNQFIEFPFFHPVKVEQEGTIIGIGEAMCNEDTGWIGNIIVHPVFQGKGIGKLITNHLVEYLWNKGVTGQLLLATEIGKPLYEKLNFQHSSKYIFLRRPKIFNVPKPEMEKQLIVPFHENYLEQIYCLDRLATGEKRQKILKHFTTGAQLIVESGDVKAFYFPQIGDGLIIAKAQEAGIALSWERLSHDQNIITIPEQNAHGIKWAKSLGFEPYRWAYKMQIGKLIPWQPEMIYSRIGGYLG